MKRLSAAIIPILLLSLQSGVSRAQSPQEALVTEIRRAYENLNYREAEIKAREALKAYQRFTAAQLTEIHKILGLIYFTENDLEQAGEHFESALSLTPSLTLDPVYVSPKILEFFNTVKQESEQATSDAPDRGEIRYVLVEDPRPAAVIRSMILPGWGQLYKHEKTKGRLLLALWGLSVSGAVAAHFVREDAEEAYLNEADPGQIDSRYDRFDTFHKLRNNLILLSAGVWLFSYLDAALNESPPDRMNPGPEYGLHLQPAASPQQLGLSLSFQF